jgi:SAM-dependent methyltransferase
VSNTGEGARLAAATRGLAAWQMVTGLVGTMLVAAGMGDGGAALTLAAGAALVALAGASVALRRPLSTLLATDASPGVGRPYASLFLISFVVLFIEVMLIRYVGSQVRIFSFYRNVPLVGAFLGLGLGCCLGGGRSRHALSFLLWLVPLVAVFSQGARLIDEQLGVMAALASSEHILGDAVVTGNAGAIQALVQVVMGLFCVVTLASVTGLFALLGRLLGEAFEHAPRLGGYTANILGSLAGILGFVALSWLMTPPWVWFGVGLLPLLCLVRRRGELLPAGLLVLVVAALVAPGEPGGATVWSPYQKLVGRQVAGPQGTTAYEVEISDVFYQVAMDLRPDVVGHPGPFPHYGAIYESLPRPGRVLVVGAGTGNDVAAALRAGAQQVDAIDIDPAIVAMGRAHHPERPYDDPRVRVLVDDARAAFKRLPPASYDVVVFGLLDSHTQLGLSSVRLDNYVFTRESFLAARRLLRPDGAIAVAAATFRPWFKERLEQLVAATCDGPVLVSGEATSWRTYVGRIADPAAEPRPSPRTTLLPTDDWPFLYLPDRAVPRAYVVVVIMLAAASVLVLRWGGLRAGSFGAGHGHLFFLGAAFLLMEVHAINRLALLFGTTWVVSAVTIALVLSLIVAANVTVMALQGRRIYPMAYAALIGCLVASAILDPTALVGRGLAASLAVGLVLLSPIYCAGLIFARSFQRAELAGPAIGANILGSVLGGWIEYSTMAFGIRAMVLVAGAFYLASLVLLVRWQRGVVG